MEIILLKNYEGLGEAGDVVCVKPGSRKNKLIPEGVALRLKRNMAVAQEKRRTKVLEKFVQKLPMMLS